MPSSINIVMLSLFIVQQCFFYCCYFLFFSISDKNQAGEVSVPINHNIKSALPEVYELAYLYAEVIKSAPCIWSTGYQATQQVLSLTKARHIILLSCASSPCTHTHITGELLSHVKLFNWNIKPDLDNRTYYSINTNN